MRKSNNIEPQQATGNIIDKFRNVVCRIEPVKDFYKANDDTIIMVVGGYKPVVNKIGIEEFMNDILRKNNLLK